MTKPRGTDEALLLGNRLKAARIASGDSQEVAAAKIGVTVGTLSKYELGKLGMTVSVLRDIASVYAIDLNDLIGVEYDVEKPGTPNVELFIAGRAGIKKPLSAEAIRSLRSLRWASGDIPLTAVEMIHSQWEASHRGVAAAPEIKAIVNVAAGQKTLDDDDDDNDDDDNNYQAPEIDPYGGEKIDPYAARDEMDTQRRRRR